MRIDTKPKVAVPALALAVALVLPTLAPAGPGSQSSARLKGNEEVPGPGDPNGRGEAVVNAKPSKRRVCFQVSWVRIEPPTAAHIHAGVEGEAGPIKVTLFEGTPPSDIVEGCARKLKRKLVKRIARRPEKFYVNVHNAPFPAGAIRGQLEPVR